MKDAIIAVTGASGFIGSYLCRQLSDNGYNVIPIFSKADGDVKGPGRKCDITDSKSILDAVRDSDIVVHLAAISNPSKCTEDFESAYKINVEGTRNMITATASKRLIFISSSHVYGRSVNNEGICSELDPLSGRTAYAITKVLGETLCNNYCWNYGHKIQIARLFNIFGEGQPISYVIPSVTYQAISQSKIIIRNMRIVRDFLYISDATKALISLIDREENSYPQVYNVSSANPIPISRIIEYVSKRVKGVAVEDLSVEDSEPPTVVGTNDKLRDIGWRQETSLYEGLDRMMKFYLEKTSS